ncbi:hypothetical protein K505DRAFT_342476 [Melanomma pulvis-pyrius CBS 109.77]|uniref:Uncharacterized protein n=1 Tax=Melanomma pulvis-pyrius CBS 109.77 TaxID=1314802 RepID=A0A6A6WVS0_9PLEO|nr:hypothetical protein K505DRAFT_342476 [Melanomma pulvis-pyrius CBS 109.77]
MPLNINGSQVRDDLVQRTRWAAVWLRCAYQNLRGRNPGVPRIPSGSSLQEPNVRQVSSSRSSREIHQQPASRSSTPLDEGWAFVDSLSDPLKCIAVEPETCQPVWVPVSDPRSSIIPADLVPVVVGDMVQARIDAFMRNQKLLPPPQHIPINIEAIGEEHMSRPSSTLEE